MNDKNEINYVVFDLFGTLVKPGIKHHPFRQLLKWARANGRQIRNDDARTIMTVNGDIRAISEKLGTTPSNQLLKTIEAKIENEISNVALYDDVIPTLNDLKTRGIKIGLCSNLAQPYGAVIDTLLSSYNLNNFLSYELGAIKPEIRMYEEILKSFSCKPEQCLFIGDTFDADYAGPTAIGMKALELTRNGSSYPHQIVSLSHALEFLDYEHLLPTSSGKVYSEAFNGTYR
jgi:HAD superfamily hydrolase (TIGR01549 family)